MQESHSICCIFDNRCPLPFLNSSLLLMQDLYLTCRIVLRWSSPWLVVVCFNCLFHYYCYVQVSASRHQIDLICPMLHAEKFTTKPCLHKVFSNLWHLQVVFMCVCVLFIFAALRICSWLNLKFAFSNRGLVVLWASLMPSCKRAVLWSIINTIIWNNVVWVKYWESEEEIEQSVKANVTCR